MSYVIEVGMNTDVMNVVETPDGFGSFATQELAAERIIEIADRRIHTLKLSRRRAERAMKRAAK